MKKNLDEFFKPSVHKILISIFLLGITIVLSFPPISYIIFPFYFTMLLVYNLPVYSVPIFFLIAYIFSCYIAKNKLGKGTIFFLITLIIVAVMFVSLIYVYNKTFGRSCNEDDDCTFRCGAGAINKRYVPIDDPFVMVECFWATAICENNQCKYVRLDSIKSPEECERIKETYMKNHCYYYLAKNLNETSFCEKITEEWFKEKCKQIIG